MTATYAVRLTGIGRSAVASVMLDGAMATDMVLQFFATSEGSLPKLVLNRPSFGRWTWAGHEEELVVCRVDHSRFEIHCHGGRLPSRAILDSLEEAGAVVLSMANWLEEFEPNSQTRAAKQLLTTIKTEKNLCILLDQMRGALQRDVVQIGEFIRTENFAGAERAVRVLIERGCLGCRLGQPFSVSVVGPPNAGKSSLINAIAGFNRAIVCDHPGTTRDLVTVETAINGWPFVLTDTAGIRDTNDQIEREGIRLAKSTLGTADLVLHVDDLTTDASPVELGLSGQRALRVGTKADLTPDAEKQVDVATSAVTHTGVAELLDLITRAVLPSPPAPGDAIPLSTEVVTTLDQLADAISRRQLAGAEVFVARLLST